MYPMRKIPLETKLKSSDVFGWKEDKVLKFFFRCQRILAVLLFPEFYLQLEPFFYVY